MRGRAHGEAAKQGRNLYCLILSSTFPSSNIRSYARCSPGSAIRNLFSRFVYFTRRPHGLYGFLCNCRKTRRRISQASFLPMSRNGLACNGIWMLFLSIGMGSHDFFFDACGSLFSSNLFSFVCRYRASHNPRHTRAFILGHALSSLTGRVMDES